MIRKSRDKQACTCLRGLQKAGLHFDGDAAACLCVERPPRDRHRHIEQRHEHAAVRDRPTIEVPGLEIERNYRAAVSGADEFDSELFDKRHIEPERGGLSHAKPYPAPSVHVNKRRAALRTLLAQ
jgi:hypothetical protein